MFYDVMVQDTASDYANYIVSSSSNVAFPNVNGPTAPRDQNMYLNTSRGNPWRTIASSPTNSVTHSDSGNFFYLL